MSRDRPVGRNQSSNNQSSNPSSNPSMGSAQSAIRSVRFLTTEADTESSTGPNTGPNTGPASGAQKPLFIFLPGMDGSGTLLRPQMDGLGAWFDIRCMAISPNNTSDWRSLSHDVGELIRHEVGEPHPNTVRNGPRNGRRRAVYLCGESFGGCLAMQVLTQQPELFERLILVNPASSFRRLPWMQLGPLLTRQLPNMAYRYSAKGIVPFLIESHRVAMPERQALEEAMGTVPAKTAAWRMSLLSRFQVERLPLERMMHPVLLIAGGCDRLLPSNREAKSLVARFPNAQLTLLPNSGHACLLEKSVNLQKILQQAQFLTP